jgi:hypothetical protein
MMGIVPEVHVHRNNGGKEYLEIIVTAYLVPISVNGKY